MGGMTSCDGPACGRDDEGDERKTKRRSNTNGKRRNSTTNGKSTNGINGDHGSPSSTSGRRGSRQLVYVQAASSLPSPTQRRPSHTGSVFCLPFTTLSPPPVGIH
jgi:hypothetical protein